jgi:hypothetical protein
MRRNSVWIFLAAAWAAAFTTAPTAATAQEMTAPALKVGDRWVYRETDLLTQRETGRITETLVAADDAAMWLDQQRSTRTWWRLDPKTGVPREQFAAGGDTFDQRGKTIGTNDGACAYPWPLKVGMKFECSEGATFPNGWKLRYSLKFAVEAAESIETPAGRFDTLRLVASGFVDNLTTNNNNRHERVIWLAPAIKREVKHEIRTVQRTGVPFRVEGRELVEFKAGTP